MVKLSNFFSPLLVECINPVRSKCIPSPYAPLESVSYTESLETSKNWTLNSLFVFKAPVAEYFTGKKFWPLTSEKRSVVITIQRGLQFFWALVPAQVYAGRDGWFGDERPAILYPNCFASGYLRHWSVSWSCFAGNETDVGGVGGGGRRRDASAAGSGTYLHELGAEQFSNIPEISYPRY